MKILVLILTLLITPALARGVAPVLKPSSGGLGNGASAADSLTVNGRSLATLANDVFNIADYGAKCDGSTDDDAAINATILAAYNSPAYQNNDAVEITGPHGAGTTGCIMHSANFTRFNKGTGANPRPRVELSHMTWLCTGARNICLDALGADFIEVHDFSIRGDNVAPPEICIQFGVINGVSSAWNKLTRANCGGYFTFTLLYNVGSEANTYSESMYSNLYVARGPIWSLGAIAGGSGYGNGVYAGVPLTGGSCVISATVRSCATATITVAGGAVTAVNISSGGYQGRDYAVGDVLSAAASSLGGTGSGFSVPVAVLRNYAVVLDGVNHWRSASAFVASTLPVDAGTSSTLLTGVGLNMRGNLGGVWISGFGGPTFINSYVVAGGTSCVDMYKSVAGGWGYNFGLNCEGATSYAFFLTGPNVAASYPHFSWSGYHQGTVATFGVDSNITSVSFTSAKIAQDYLTPVVPMFANAPIWTVTGDASVNSVEQWNAPSSASRVRLTTPTSQADPGPVDIFPNAAIALSAARQINHSYYGPLINVQRTSDSTAMDIYPDANGNLDRGAFQAFCTNTTCNVAKVFDQSGNGNTCTQTTVASQPTLTLSVTALNYRPTMTWATASALTCGSAASIANIFASGGYALAAVNQNTNAQQNRLAYKISGAVGWEWRAAGASASPYMSFLQGDTTAGQWDYLTAVPLASHVYDVAYSSASLANAPTIGLDGLAISLSAAQPIGTITSDVAVPLLLGNNAVTGGTRGFIGAISEFVLWKATPTAAQIEALRRNEGAFYGIAAQ